MDKAILDHLSEALSVEIIECNSVAGGDINHAHLLETTSGKIFIKWNDVDFALDMFDCESKALQAIAAKAVIKTPEVLHIGSIQDVGYLALSYVEQTQGTSPPALIEFGRQLAKLHAPVNNKFGWESDNYIGTLIQSNKEHEDWEEFYITQRIEKQLTLAKSNQHLQNLSLRDVNKFYKETSMFLEGMTASLLHGDLWSGNYILSRSGDTYLIDPASYYGHHEVDLAMTELFGRFDQGFYDGYNAVLRISKEYSERKDIYQLYYLLVHLNLFGKSYEAACEKILKMFK